MKLSDFLEEAAIMKEMKHPNLVQVRPLASQPAIQILKISQTFVL